MLRFVFQKIRNKKWMIASLLLGNLLMVAIAAAVPMYCQASAQRALTRALGDYMVETGKYPGTVTAEATYQYLPNYPADRKTAAYEELLQSKQVLDQAMEELGIPALMQISGYTKSAVKAEPVVQVDDDTHSTSVRLLGYSELEEHIQITHGRLYSAALDGDNTIEVIVNEKTFMEQQLMLEQEFVLPNLLAGNGQPYRLRITGIFTNKDAQDPYWITSPNRWTSVCLMDYDLFAKLFVNLEQPSQSVEVTWHTILDYTQFQEHDAAEYLRILEELTEKADGLNMDVSFNFRSVLTAFLPAYQKLTTTVWVLLLPVFVLLAVFVFMVSRQMLQLEQNEISVYKSRGANKLQIVGIYLLQSVCICLVGLLGGVPLGMLICRVLGASNAFLEFVRRTALPLELSRNVWLFAGLAALFSVCTMVLPVFRYANVDIVDHKRQKNRVSRQPGWMIGVAGVILLGLSAYGLYQYNQQKQLLAQKVLEGASLDPLLYLCSSLFMVGCALTVLWLFPLLIRLVFRIGRKWWSPALYASFLRVIRANGNQGFLMVFTILMVALGIFNAQTARTINANAQDKIRYMAGADIVLQEVWDSNENMLAEQLADSVILTPSESKVTYTEPDFNTYLNLDGVQSATRVLVAEDLSVSVKGGKVKNAMLMGIHTKEFGETAWFKASLLPYHYHEYLNAISQNASAILVSSNFRDVYGYQVGDVLHYTSNAYGSSRGVIYGFVDYWPTYAPVTVAKDADGLYKETDNFLIVANLAHLQSEWGVTPYQVWIDAEDSTQFIYEHAAATETKYALFRDAAAQLLELKNDPVFQGTNGILTIGFVCILLLCSIGFLIYWILSIQSRTLQFGIFRAMGMTVREVFTMLISEQVLITGVSMGAGVLVGILSARLFVPLVQIAYSSADQVIPVEIVSQGSDYVRLFAVIGTVIALCMVILGVLISRIKISQALKLGED